MNRQLLKNCNDTTQICCSSESDCEKARMIIPMLANLLEDSEISDLFRPPSTDDVLERKVRALYLGANYEENGELFKKIAKCSRNVRSQAELAVRAADHPSLNTSLTRYEIGMLVVKAFAGTGFNGSQVEPDLVGEAIMAISVDCFAGFCQEHFIDEGKLPLVMEGDGRIDAVELGILAVTRFLSKANLTSTAFCRLTRRASSGPFNPLAGKGLLHFKRSKTWPPALGWECLENCIEGVAVRQLLSIDDLRTEGHVMSNCLARGTYDDEALLGRLNFFSLMADEMRATVSLSLSVSEDEKGQSIADAYYLHDLKGPKNADPAPVFQTVAAFLLEKLNAGLPRCLDTKEVARRKKLEACFLSRRASFCSDVSQAAEYWRRHYLPTLPPRLRHFSLAEIVDEIQDYE